MKNLPKEYVNYLNTMVDDIYGEAAKKWDWKTAAELQVWANEAKLHPTTVWNLGTGKTKIPQLLTVWKLARSVGWSLQLSGKLKLRKSA